MDIIIWAHNYRTKICEEDGFLFMVAGDGNIEYFMPPISIGDNGKIYRMYMHGRSTPSGFVNYLEKRNIWV